MHVPLSEILAEGDMRTTGRSAEVVEVVLDSPERLHELMMGMEAPDPGVRMRSSDALEKVTAIHPEWLVPMKDQLLRISRAATQQEVQWHCAQLLSRLPVSAQEAGQIAEILEGYLNLKSAIVKACAIEALAHLALKFPERKDSTQAMILLQMVDGTAAVVARCKRALKLLSRA